MSDFLFQEFEEVSAKAWKQKIQADLKGADYNKTLIWENNENIPVKPFYHSDDFQDKFSPVPGQPRSWAICQSIFIDDQSIANKLAIEALKRGAETVHFTAKKEFSPNSVFEGLDEVTLYIELHFLSESFITKLKDYLKETNTIAYIFTDIVGNLTRSGNWFQDLKNDHSILDEITNTVPSEVNLNSVDISLYQNAGANIVQQLAYALAHANEYLNHFDNKKNSILKEKPLVFKVAVGSNYFFEIAKLRALRIMYTALAKEYGFHSHCHLFVIPSKRNKTIYDYNVNMLRTTTECMSAIIGGADTICNQPYDVLYHKSNEFAERIARNQLLILRKESYFEAVSNPADGAYYIESLTRQMAEKAMVVFKEIETGGGFLTQLKAGIIQKKIKESAGKEQEEFDQGKKVLLGTNKHPNKNERMKDDLELYPFTKTNIRKTLLEPIIEKRLAENIEQERLNGETYSE